MSSNSASFFKSTNEASLAFSRVQERMEQLYELTNSSILLGTQTSLFSFNLEQMTISINVHKEVVPTPRVLENRNRFFAARRLGAWFAQHNTNEITNYLGIVF